MNLFNTFQKYHNILFESPPSQLGQTTVQDVKQKSVEMYHPFAEFDEISSTVIKRFEENDIDFIIKDKTILVRNLKTIPYKLCYFFVRLTSLVIPSTVTSIGYGAFRGCISLKNVVIPSSVTSIGDYAFRACKSIRNVVIPTSVTSIGEDAFADCWGLTSVVIPSSVTSIGEDAFAGCPSLKKITLPKRFENKNLFLQYTNNAQIQFADQSLEESNHSLFEYGINQSKNRSIEQIRKESDPITNFYKWYRPLEERFEKCILKAYSPNDTHFGTLIEGIKEYYTTGKYFENEIEKVYLEVLKGLAEAFVGYLEDPSNIDSETGDFMFVDVRGWAEGWFLDDFLSDYCKEKLCRVIETLPEKDSRIDLEFYCSWGSGRNKDCCSADAGLYINPDWSIDVY